MFNGVEKVPKKLLSRVENLGCEFTFKNILKDLLTYIAQSDIYNASFLYNFDLYFGDTYNTENLIFHFEVNENNVCIYDENTMGDRCKLFFEFVNNAQELDYGSDKNDKLFAIAKDYAYEKTQILIKALEKMKNDKYLLLKYSVKKIKTRRERINSKIEEILNRKLTS